MGIGRQSIYLLAKDVKSSPLTLRELGGIQFLGSHVQNLMIRQGVGTKLILNIVLDITFFLCYSTTRGWYRFVNRMSVSRFLLAGSVEDAILFSQIESDYRFAVKNMPGACFRQIR